MRACAQWCLMGCLESDARARNRCKHWPFMTLSRASLVALSRSSAFCAEVAELVDALDLGSSVL